MLPTSSELCPRAYIQESHPATGGQVCRSCPLVVAPQLRRGANPSLNNQTCLLLATPACCTFANFELRILLATLREQPAHVSVPSEHLVFGASDQLGIMPQGRHTGIETGLSVTKKVRFVVSPRVPPDLVLIFGRSQAVLRGTSFQLREQVQVGLL